MSERFTQVLLYVPAQEILVLITLAQRPPIYPHAGISRGASGLMFCLSIPLLPYYVYARREVSGETVRMSLLADAMRTKNSCAVPYII